MATAMERLLELHDPAARELGMVYSVWEDGEITLEKGGDLFGQRTLHCIAYGVGIKAQPKDAFPWQNTDHGRIFVRNYDDAELARQIILGA